MNRNNILALLVLVAMPMLLAACTLALATRSGGRVTAPGAAPLAPAGALTLDVLKNLEYRSEFPASGVARLVNGVYQQGDVRVTAA